MKIFPVEWTCVDCFTEQVAAIHPFNGPWVTAFCSACGFDNYDATRAATAPARAEALKVCERMLGE